MDRIRQAVLQARAAETGPSLRARRPGARAPGRPAPAARLAPPPLDDLPLADCQADLLQRHRIIAHQQDPILRAYRVLRTRVLQKMEAEGWRTIAVASPGPGAGKTVTAVNLAIAIGAQTGSRATLIDLDFYRPTVAKYLGLSGFGSTVDYFEGERTLRECAVRLNAADVCVVANERVSSRGAEFVTSPRMDALIEAALGDFGSRAVVFDISPLLGCDDAIAFLPRVDCVLFIAASGQTRIADLRESLRLLKDANVIGSVLNKAPVIHGGAYEYY